MANELKKFKFFIINWEKNENKERDRLLVELVITSTLRM